MPTRAAFEERVSRYHPAVFSIAYRMTASRAEAEDISQEVFLRPYRSLDRYAPALPLAPWIRKIAANDAPRDAAVAQMIQRRSRRAPDRP